MRIAPSIRRMACGAAGLLSGFVASAVVLMAIGQAPIPQPLLHVIGADTLSLTSSYVELIVQDEKRRQFGLCTSAGSFLESFSVQDGSAAVLEGGIIRKTTAAPNGTTLRISIADGAVGFVKNGAALFVSPTVLTEAPHVEVALQDGTTVLGRLTTWSQ